MTQDDGALAPRRRRRPGWRALLGACTAAPRTGDPSSLACALRSRALVQGRAPALLAATVLGTAVRPAALASTALEGDAPIAEEAARAEPEPADPQPAPSPSVEASTDPAPPKKPYKWHWIAIPYVYYTTTDKLGIGVGAELYDRKREEDFGYRYRLSLSSLFTTSGNYSSNYLQLERRGAVPWVLRATYRLWRNMVYVGNGGVDAAVRNGEEAFGNALQGPSLMGMVQIPIRRTPLFVFTQGYARYAAVDPRAGGPLDVRRPYGVDGGFYFDVSAGVFLHEVDRWPMPHKGVRFETSARAGGTASAGGFEPLFGVNTELFAWHPLAGRHLVLGTRLLFDKTWGERPFWEGENLGGTLRDELAYEQMLTGYGRTRTRGDGTASMMLELRPMLGETGHPTIDIGFYLSAYAEASWLFDGDDPGPFLPSVGVAPLLLWQGAIELRPWLAWGWMADTPGADRTPETQFGISLLSPL